MKFIAIDPSSTLLGWAMFDDSGLLSYNIIDARKIEYERRYLFITGELTTLWREHKFVEIALEEPFHNPELNTAALKVAEMSIRKWAERIESRGDQMDVYRYHPATWKSSVTGNGNAKKEEIARIIWLQFGERFKKDGTDLSEHTLDAIAIGLYHAGIKKWEGMATEGK